MFINKYQSFHPLLDELSLCPPPTAAVPSTLADLRDINIFWLNYSDRCELFPLVETIGMDPPMPP